MIDPNEAAFPWKGIGAGLTKREYFAALIYQGMNAIPDTPQNRCVSAQIAVQCADALIKELSK